MTVPEAAARIGVPLAAAMSIPGWNEQSPFARQRAPKGLAIGPWTGQISPEDDGAGAGLGLSAADGGEPVEVDVAVVVGVAARAAAAA
jgi:hypothetical protein